MKHSVQIRVRLPRDIASQWLELPPSSRAKAVALVLRSAATIDLNALVGMRRELANLGTLLSQSLRINRGSYVNEHLLKECVDLLQSLRQ